MKQSRARLVGDSEPRPWFVFSRPTCSHAVFFVTSSKYSKLRMGCCSIPGSVDVEHDCLVSTERGSALTASYLFLEPVLEQSQIGGYLQENPPEVV